MIFFHWFFSYSVYLPVGPDIIFIYVFWVNYFFSPISSLTFSFFAGICADFYYNLPFGTHCLVFVLLSFVINSIRKNVDIESLIPRLINFVISNYSVQISLTLINLIINQNTDYDRGFFIQPLINILFFEIFNILFLKFFKKRRNYVRI